MDPAREVAAAAVAHVFQQDPEGSGAMGDRIRMMELQLAWALGVIEAGLPEVDLTAAYHELYTPGPVFTEAR
jgi:hypothetical protein